MIAKKGMQIAKVWQICNVEMLKKCLQVPPWVSEKDLGILEIYINVRKYDSACIPMIIENPWEKKWVYTKGHSFRFSK